MFSAGHYQILSTLGRSGSKSRTELAAALGLSKATISALVRDLLDRQILCERQLVFGLGRPSVSLGIRPDAANFIGISLQADPAVLLLTDLHGQTRARVEIPRESDPERCIAALHAAIGSLRAEVGEPGGEISGIGIALPGFVSRDRRTCLASTALGWSDVDIGSRLTALTGLPTYVENDANALILGEQLFGIMRGCPDFSMIFVGDGIGSAHIVDGRLLRGYHGGAGEISHAPVTIEGYGARPCRCGNKGCLETVASLTAIRGAARRGGLPDDVDQLAVMAADGHPEALGLLHAAGSALGISTAQIIQMFDPSHVVVMLAPALHEGVYGRALRQECETHVLRRAGAQTTLYLRDAATDSFASGAASLAAHYFLFGEDET